MKNITLIIPAKNEPNALPLVLTEIKELNLDVQIIIILDKNDLETINAAKNLIAKLFFKLKKDMVMLL